MTSRLFFSERFGIMQQLRIVAAALVDGDVGLETFLSERLDDDRILTLAQKIEASVDPESDYPAHCPARLTVQMRDPIWDALYTPLVGFVAFATEKLNVLQFLTIRRYLSLVFGALVLLLLVLAAWP